MATCPCTAARCLHHSFCSSSREEQEDTKEFDHVYQQQKLQPFHPIGIELILIDSLMPRNVYCRVYMLTWEKKMYNGVCPASLVASRSAPALTSVLATSSFPPETIPILIPVFHYSHVYQQS